MKKTFLAGLFFGLVALIAGPSSDGQLLQRRSGFGPVPTTAPTPMQAPVAAASDGKTLGPVACAIVRIELAKSIQKKRGIGRLAALREARDIDDETINSFVPAAEKAAKAKFGAIGDGTIINAIIDFFKSPQGQALIQALIELLLHALGADSGIDPIHVYLVTWTTTIPPPGIPPSRC